MRRTTLFMLPLLLLWGTLHAQETVMLRMIGDENVPNYNITIIKRALEADGLKVRVEYLGSKLPTTRLEAMIQSGDATCAILGETPDRNSRMVPIRIGMTDGLMGKRILFIPKGSQPAYDKVRTLEDFRATGKTAGMGAAWADVGIWEKNGLKVIGQSGDWKVLYKMVEAGNRKVDYLPRGAAEILMEMKEHRYLDVEARLLFVYDKDSIVYVSPKDPAFKARLETALVKARDSGLIKQTVAEFYKEVFEPPLDIDKRTVIKLALP